MKGAARPGAARGALRVAQKELRDILREKSIVVALLVQFFIAAFSAFLAVGLLALYDPESVRAEVGTTDVAYTGPGGFDRFLRSVPNLEVERVDAAAALAGFRAGEYSLVVQEEWAEDGARTVTLLLPDGQLQTTLLVTQLKGLLEEYEEELRRERQGRLVHAVRSLPDLPDGRAALPYLFLHATLVPLLLLTPVFLSGAIASDSLVAELQSRSLTVLRSTPASLAAILWGKLLVPLALAPLQFLLWVGLLALNGIRVANLPLLALASLLLTMLLAGIGYALAARLRRDGPTQAAYALAALTLAGLGMLLPRDPLNLVAYLGTGRIDAAAAASLAILGIASAIALAAGFADAARSIRRRPD